VITGKLAEVILIGIFHFTIITNLFSQFDSIENRIMIQSNSILDLSLQVFIMMALSI